MCIICFNLSPFGRRCDFQMVGGMHAEGGMQSHEGQVSTLTHANKTARVSHGKGFLLHST